MKVLVFLALCAVGNAAVFNQFYPFDRENGHRVSNGDNATSEQYRLNVPVIFYDNVFNGISVNTDGFITLGVVGHESEEVNEAVLAPFMFDLNNEITGEVYYEELNDKETLIRATGDIRRVFEETASTFEATAVFVTTWIRLQSHGYERMNFTFQSIVVTDGLSSYAIFLYPIDELATGENADVIRQQLMARVGFSDSGGNQLELLSAGDLLEGGNALAPGEWIFQIGGVLLTLDDEIPAHHVKAEPVHNRRQSGFVVEEVNFEGDYDEDCSAECDISATCTPFTNGYCCQCNDGFTGNGESCISIDEPARYNGYANGFLIVMNPDQTWTNETARSMDVHGYASPASDEDTRAFSVLAGEVSSRLILALQPMPIFGTTLGWMFAGATAPAINGFQYSGGKITSDTYIRYNTGPYEFRITQTYYHPAEIIEGEGKVLEGTMTFSGRLPAVEPGSKIKYQPYTQVYSKHSAGSIRTRDIRSYTVGDGDGNITHTYSIDQRIQFDECEHAYEEVPQNLAVDVDGIFIEYFESERTLRFAMNNNIKPADEVGVRPSETVPSVDPNTPPVVTESPPEETLTLCQERLRDAHKIRAENPYSSELLVFPTCTSSGEFAPRQCRAYDSICWCVDQASGIEIEGTETLPQEGYDLDCSDVVAPEYLTSCQAARADAEARRIEAGSEASSIFMPRCMESGAYEPVQQLPDGSFMCVDFSGDEISRSTEQPQCLTQCQLQAYVAKSNNIFLETNEFEVRCEANGDYSARQCEVTYCYCVDTDGIEIFNSRVETTIPGEDVYIDCEKFRQDSEVVPTSPTTTERSTTRTTQQSTSPVTSVRLIFAQSMGINSINLPVTRDNAVSKRLFASSGQMAIAVAYDCHKRTYYWSDLSRRRIYSSEINGPGTSTVVLGSRLGSPEGIAVDYITGNIYWTDSDLDRVEVASSDGSNRMVLVNEGMVNPRGIAVDPVRGRMYWTDWNRPAPKVWAADMDGKNKKVIVSTDLELPNDITIEVNSNRICFVDAGTYKIECVDDDGQRRQTIYQMKQVPRPHPFGLAVNGDMLYYSSWGGTKAVYAVNWRTGDQIPIRGPRGSHGQMYGVAIAYDSCPGFNDCSISNGGCSHLCIPTPSGRVCKCPPGATDCEE